tara:strand:+ start:880 stop:1434 length:555 start_codon:yes stop_codon:yes gene_type:complete
MSWTQRNRAEIISKTYKPWASGAATALDVGCGNAEVSVILAKNLGLNIHGTDINDYRLPSASTIPFTCMETPEKLPFKDDFFDIVMFNDMLHHTEDAEPLLREGKRIARKAVLVFEDQETWLLRKIDVSLNFQYCSSMPCPLNFKSDKEWKALFSKLGMSAEEIDPKYPIWYPIRHYAFRLTAS